MIAVDPPGTPPLELWGGLECSNARLPGHRENQLARTGHDIRPGDLERFAALGLAAIRYPILWEDHAGDPIDWTWADERLGLLRRLNLRPIVGLLHHGCGPLPGGLLDAGFVPGFARFARQVAERYPWIDAYTPINEPLTTARFSGLYGMWHPFARDDRSFAALFLRQAQAIRAAMEAIREVNPAARLVQTEDLGRTHSTPLLAYQARFENERRWLTFDLLSGRLDPHGIMQRQLIKAGIQPAELADFAARPCAPDIVGLNYYVTSERFLDERTIRYPAAHPGGNGRHAYVDVPAVRAHPERILGCAGVLQEAWQRYGLPLAITESQLDCSRDEQLRWLRDGWRACQAVRSTGARVCAFTSWALLGAYDWDSLLCLRRGHYESGAFDVQSGQPQPTAVAVALASLARNGDFNHPAAAGPGWWKRPLRFGPDPISGYVLRDHVHPAWSRFLAILADDREFRELADRICALRGLNTVVFTTRDIPHGAPLLESPLGRVHPWAMIVQDRDSESETSPASLCALREGCASARIPIVEMSTDGIWRVNSGETPQDPVRHDGLRQASALLEILGLGGSPDFAIVVARLNATLDWLIDTSMREAARTTLPSEYARSA